MQIASLSKKHRAKCHLCVSFQGSTEDTGFTVTLGRDGEASLGFNIMGGFTVSTCQSIMACCHLTTWATPIVEMSLPFLEDAEGVCWCAFQLFSLFF